MLTFFTRHELNTFGAFNIGGLNSSGQVPQIAGNRGLIDAHTPQDVNNLIFMFKLLAYFLVL
jgi:beta-glucan synthesis-associated protein KRE6